MVGEKRGVLAAPARVLRSTFDCHNISRHSGMYRRIVTAGCKQVEVFMNELEAQLGEYARVLQHARLTAFVRPGEQIGCSQSRGLHLFGTTHTYLPCVVYSAQQSNREPVYIILVRVHIPRNVYVGKNQIIFTTTPTRIDRE